MSGAEITLIIGMQILQAILSMILILQVLPVALPLERFREQLVRECLLANYRSAQRLQVL